jgi:ketosteroid isomerase-like protein
MSIRFPFQVAVYLDAVARDDLEAALATFTPDAVVIDEGRERRGAEIREWRQTTASEYTYTTDFRTLAAHDETHFVALHHLEGDFPGGVVDLRYRFDLAPDGRITRLEIAP